MKKIIYTIGIIATISFIACDSKPKEEKKVEENLVEVEPTVEVEKDAPIMSIIMDTSKAIRGTIKSNLEKFSFTEGVLTVNGWAFEVDGENHENNEIHIALINNNEAFLYETTPSERTDVGEFFKNEDIINCGFERTATLDLKRKGTYEVAIAIKKGEEEVLVNSFEESKMITIN